MTAADRNPLLPLHQRAGAETQAYDEIEIVSTFGEPQAEYAAIRKASGLMDLPQRGIVELTGKDRHGFLNNLLTQQTFDKATKTGLTANRAVYAFLLNLKGRVVLDLNVLELGDHTWLELDDRLVPMLVRLLDRYLFAEQVKVVSQSGLLHSFALHGPRAHEILAAETGADRLGIGDCITTKIMGVETIIFRDDLCGVPGLQWIAPVHAAASIWQHLLARHGQEISLGKRLLRPIGWAAFNAARIEAGRPLFGVDFELAEPAVPGAKAQAAEENAPRPVGVLPAETGLLDRAVSFTKGCYLGQEVVARMHARNQVARKLVGLRMDDDALPIAGQVLLDAQQNQVGVVTSSTMSPALSDAAIALALVRKPHFEVGSVLNVAAEGSMRTCRVVAMPFLGSNI